MVVSMIAIGGRRIHDGMTYAQSRKEARVPLLVEDWKLNYGKRQPCKPIEEDLDLGKENCPI